MYIYLYIYIFIDFISDFELLDMKDIEREVRIM